MERQRFSFGDFTLDAGRGVLLRDGVPVAIGQRAVALLEALVAADGRVVAKEALIDAAWPGAVVEESNLTVQIAALRKALGPAPGGGECIVTVARVGYRFAPAVRSSPADAPTSPAPITASLAVLPLANLSGDPGQEYFADGVTEDLIMALSRFRWFRVIGRSGSFAFKGRPLPASEIAARLGVRYLLEGSLRRSAGRTRIALQLTDAQDGTGLWAEHYDFAPADTLAIQDAIAEQVAGAIEPELLQRESRAAARRPSGTAVTAQDLVHRGTFLFHRVQRATHLQARELFREAARLDPGLAAAQFWLARVSAGIVAYGWSDAPQDDIAEGLEAAGQAIRSDERNPYAHYALAIVSAYAGRLEQAMGAGRRAVELAPGFALGHLVLGMGLLYGGDATGAAAALARGLQLNAYDPQNFVWQHLLAYARLFSGDAPGALAAARESQQSRPDWPPALLSAACAHVAMGEHARARECTARATAVREPQADPAEPMKRGNPAWAQRIAQWLDAARAPA